MELQRGQPSTISSLVAKRNAGERSLDVMTRWIRAWNSRWRNEWSRVPQIRMRFIRIAILVALNTQILFIASEMKGEWVWVPTGLWWVGNIMVVVLTLQMVRDIRRVSRH